jgi:hypothetical protein
MAAEVPGWENWIEYLMYTARGWNETGNATISITAVRFYGQTSTFVTTFYDGRVATQPGPGATVCQWQSISAGSFATVVLSEAPGSGNERGCGSAGWPTPLNVTVGWTSTTGDPGSLSLFGVAPLSQLTFSGLNDVINAYGPPLPVDAQTVRTFGVSSGAAGAGLRFLVFRGPLNDGQRYDSTLISVSPLLADGDVVVFVTPYITIDSYTSDPKCTDPSQWPSPSEPDCTPWTWSFSVGAGGGSLFIDGSLPCAQPRLTGRGAHAHLNPSAEAEVFCAAYTRTDLLWVIVVPIGNPAVRGA